MSKDEFLRPETTFQAILGRVIVKIRKELGKEQGALAKSVGVTQSTWSRIERGESSLAVEQLARAAELLMIKPSIILQETEIAISSLEKQGVFVNKNKIAQKKHLEKNKASQGVAMIGAAALGALVVAAISKATNSN